jgi:hypothetical protein
VADFLVWFSISLHVTQKNRNIFSSFTILFDGITSECIWVRVLAHGISFMKGIGGGGLNG